MPGRLLSLAVLASFTWAQATNPGKFFETKIRPILADNCLACHDAEAYMDAYIEAADIWNQKKGPLFRSVDKRRRLTLNPMTRIDVFRMIQRRAKDAGLPSSTCCHTFRRPASPPTWTTAAPSMSC